MMLIDRSSPIPLYFQLKQILLGKINQNEWQTGDLIPSEQELQESYGLSRTTVRQTLSDLVHEGWLDRQRGRGTFVTKPKFAHNPIKRMSTTEYLTQQGIEPGWRLLDADWAQPLEDVTKKLKTSKQERVYRIRRLRLANDEPIGYHIAFLPAFIVPHINHNNLTSGGSLRYLRDAPQMANSTAARTIEANLADDYEEKWLGIAKGDPVLLIERLVTAPDGTPIELLWASYRGDRFKYQITI